MRSAIGLAAAAVLLTVATVGAAQTIETGTLVRIDSQSSVVTLDDGRMYRVTPTTVLVVDNRPTQITALRLGQRITIQAGEVVALRDGQYVALAPAPAVVAQAPSGVVVQAPPAAGVTAVPMGVRQTFNGTVQSVDRDGEVKIKTERDTFEIKVGTEALRGIKKGDNVSIDLTFTPPGAPSALPR